MTIAICSSLDFTHELKEIADKLSDMGHKVEIPLSSRRILKGEFSVDDIKTEKVTGEYPDRIVKFDAIRWYWKIIQSSDAILVTNYAKKGIESYIGGNTFLEMGFAHILNKPIYILNDIPDMLYTDEIRGMEPILLKGDLEKI